MFKFQFPTANTGNSKQNNIVWGLVFDEELFYWGGSAEAINFPQYLQYVFFTSYTVLM